MHKHKLNINCAVRDKSEFVKCQLTNLIYIFMKFLCSYFSQVVLNIFQLNIKNVLYLVF